MKNRYMACLAPVALAALLASTGCVPLVLGGAAVATGTTISTMTDRRSVGTVVNDEVLESRVMRSIDAALGSEVDRHITATSYSGKVLLTGEVATEDARQKALAATQKTQDVVNVINELTVGESAGIQQRLRDSALATKVRGKILATEDVPLNQMKVTVDRDVVYLCGLLSSSENRKACETAAAVPGVTRVVSYATILSEERMAQIRKDLEEARKRSQEAARNNQP